MEPSTNAGEKHENLGSAVQTARAQRRAPGQRLDAARLREIASSPGVGGVAAGAAALGAAILFGSLDAGTLSVLAYRLLRKRPPITYSLREGWGELTNVLLKRLGGAIVRPDSGAALALRTTEAGALGYFTFRMLKRALHKRRSRGQASAPQHAG